MYHVVGQLVSDELAIILKDPICGLIVSLSQHLLGGADISHGGSPVGVFQGSGQDSSRVSPKMQTKIFIVTPGFLGRCLSSSDLKIK